MTNIWTGSTEIPATANADNTYLRQVFAGSDGAEVSGNTVFTLTLFAYQPATGSIDVYVNGVIQNLTTDFTETSNTTFTIIGTLLSTDTILVRGLIGGTSATAAAVSASASAASAASSLAYYNAILALSLPSLPLVVGSGGTGSATKTEGFDNLAPTTTKGDLIVHNGSDNVRTPVGSNKQILVADSAQAAGVKWSFGAAHVLANINATTGAINSSQNVGSVTRNGAGDYTITFSAALNSANYICLVSLRNASGVAIPRIHAQTTTTVQIYILDAGINVDVTGLNIAVFDL